MNITNALKHLYPNAKNGIDYELQNDLDGRGDYIKTWNPALGVEPSADNLKIASDAFDAAQAQSEIDMTTKKNIIKTKLNLSDDELSTLKEAVKS